MPQPGQIYRHRGFTFSVESVHGDDIEAIRWDTSARHAGTRKFVGRDVWDREMAGAELVTELAEQEPNHAK